MDKKEEEGKKEENEQVRKRQLMQVIQEKYPKRNWQFLMYQFCPGLKQSDGSPFACIRCVNVV